VTKPLKVEQKVEQMFAFLAVDQSGDEGVLAWPLPDGTLLPLLGADMKRMETVRPFAQQIANVRGVPVKLAVFSTREERETLMPSRWPQR
jgi:hypothetical protein